MTDASELEKRLATARQASGATPALLVARDAIAYARQCEDRAREMEALLQWIVDNLETHPDVVQEAISRCVVAINREGKQVETGPCKDCPHPKTCYHFGEHCGKKIKWPDNMDELEGRN